jgi:hypothetical protein
VTEAIHKTRWIVATRAGGIPLQIRDGVDGALVPPGDAGAIADALFDFYAQGGDAHKTGESRGNDAGRPLGGRWTDDGAGPREELFAVGNAAMWMYLWNAALGPRVPESAQEQLKRIGLEGKRREFKEVHDSMVWDLLKIKQDTSGSK